MKKVKISGVDNEGNGWESEEAGCQTEGQKRKYVE